MKQKVVTFLGGVASSQQSKVSFMVSSTISTRQACALAVTTAPATSSYNDPSPRPRPPGIEPQPEFNKCEHVTSEL